MELDSASIYGQCRCCAATGRHKDLQKEYCWKGIREVYSEIILECFNFCLSSETGLSTLICNDCIARLRDARSFKNLVVNTERQLLEALEANQSDLNSSQVEIKREFECPISVKEETKISSDGEWTEDFSIETNIFQGTLKSDELEIEIKQETIKAKPQPKAKPKAKAPEAKLKPKAKATGKAAGKKKPVTRSVPAADAASSEAQSEEEKKDDSSTPRNDLVEDETKVIAWFASVKPLPRRATLKNYCQNFFEHLEALKDKSITGKSLEGMLQEDTVNPRRGNRSEAATNTSKCSNSDAPPSKKKRIRRTKYRGKEDVDIDKDKNLRTEEILTHAANITALLEFSNLTAFKSKSKRAYPCFYCEKRFEDFEELKSHQKLDHTKDNVGKCVLQKYVGKGKADKVVVYADISDLKCIICNKNIASLNDLKKHLTEVHQKKIYSELSDKVIPFKVKENNLQCQICGSLYETFGAIERHMNKHYRNYVCEECDSGFITKQRLRLHIHYMHSRSDKQYPCEVCQKQFTSKQKMKSHVQTVHENVKKYKCNRCPERFTEYFRRHKHMVLVHGVAPLEYKCNVCDKSFDRQWALSTHMRTHIQQKDIYCEVCPYRCFTNVQLKRHMIKHNGERIYECSVCKKSYAREKTLREHMRIHTNDRRFVCPVCGQAFTYKCSLKSHISSHHKEYGLMQN